MNIQLLFVAGLVGGCILVSMALSYLVKVQNKMRPQLSPDAVWTWNITSGPIPATTTASSSGAPLDRNAPPTENERKLQELAEQMDYEHRKDVARITALHAEVVRLQKMLDINDPSLDKVTLHRKEYDRLRDCESLLSEIRQIVSE